MSAPPIFLSQVFTRKLFAYSGICLLAYDYLLTLSLEVAHIWNDPWTLVKWLFLINRYGNLIGQTVVVLEEAGYLSHGSRKFCLAFQLYTPFFSVFSGESIRLFVVMRVCAIMRCRRTVTLLANTVYTLYAMGVCALSAYLVIRHNNNWQFKYLDEIGLCAAPLPVPDLWMVYLIPLVVDNCMFALMCYGLYRSTREFNAGSPSPLIRLLARDAFLFYSAALFSVLLCIICWTVYAQDPRNYLQTLIGYPILSVVGQRVVLNLRRYRTRQDLTHDLSRVVNRQIAALGIPELELELELDQLGTRRVSE